MYIHTDYTIRWDPEKNERLKTTRGASFEELLDAELVVVKPHGARPHQKLLCILFRDYIWVVPSVIRDGEVFLKKFYRSRKETKRWRRQGRL